jgi:hypothetical protein
MRSAATWPRTSLGWLFGEKGNLRALESSACLALFRVLYTFAVAFELVRGSRHRDSVFARPVYEPIDLLAYFSVEPMPLEIFVQLRWLLVGCLVCAGLGIATRWTLIGSVLGFLAYEGTYLGFTKPLDSEYVFHMTNFTAFALLVLAVAPDVGRHSLWSLLRGAKDAVPVAAWPRRVIIGAIAIGYFGAAYCKLVESPLWVDGYTLQGYMLDRGIRHEIDLAITLASSWWLCVVLSVLTIVLELTWLLVIRYPRLAWTHVPGALMLHVSILVTMNINFFQFFALNYLVFLDWSWISRRIAALRSPAGSQGAATAPSLPSGQTTHYPRFAAAFLVFLFGCVIGRVESWPLTDFRVYSKRRHPDRVGVLYLDKLNKQGERQELASTTLAKFRRAVGAELSVRVRELSRADERADLRAEIDRIRASIYRSVMIFDPKFFKRQKGLRLFVIRPEWDAKRGRYEIVRDFVMDLPPPA